MKVLACVAGFYPAETYGGPAISVKNFCTLLSSCSDIYVITSNHELCNTDRLPGIKDGWNVYSDCHVKYLSDQEMSYRHLKKEIREISPDIIYVNSLFDRRFLIPLLFISKAYNIPMLIAPRGEICGSFHKKYIKIPYINVLKPLLKQKHISFQATSEEEKEAIIKYIGNDQIYLLPNIPSMCELQPHGRVGRDSLRILFLARIQKKKNLSGALTILKECKIKIQFDIYGPKEVIEYWDECQEIIRTLPPNIIANYCGAVKHEDVSKIFASYDLFLFPTFSENYGHSIIESLQAGTPVLISDQTPWNDIAEYGAGWAIPIDKTEEYVDAINSLHNLSDKEFMQKSRFSQEYVKDKLGVDELKREYELLLNKLTTEKMSS